MLKILGLKLELLTSTFAPAGLWLGKKYPVLGIEQCLWIKSIHFIRLSEATIFGDRLT